MDYFLLLPDKRISNPLSLSIEEGKLRSSEPFVFNMGKTEKITIVDLIAKKILFNTYFLISEGIMKVFKMYDETIDYLPMCITNEDNSFQFIYWRADIKETKGVIANKFLNSEDMLIDVDVVKEKAVHKICYEKQTFILVNLYVAESILRRMPVGVFTQKVKNSNSDDNKENDNIII